MSLLVSQFYADVSCVCSNAGICTNQGVFHQSSKVCVFGSSTCVNYLRPWCMKQSLLTIAKCYGTLLRTNFQNGTYAED